MGGNRSGIFLGPPTLPLGPGVGLAPGLAPRGGPRKGRRELQGRRARGRIVLPVGDVHEVLLGQVKQMVFAVVDVVLGPDDENIVGVPLLLGEADGDLEVVHDFANGLAPLADEPGMDSAVDVNADFDHAVQVPRDVEDGLLGQLALVFVSNDCDEGGIGVVLLGELDVHAILVPQFAYNGPSSANNLGVVVRGHIHGDLVALGHFVELLGLEFEHSFFEGRLGILGIGGGADNANCVGLFSCGRNLQIKKILNREALTTTKKAQDRLFSIFMQVNAY